MEIGSSVGEIKLVKCVEVIIMRSIFMLKFGNIFVVMLGVSLVYVM